MKIEAITLGCKVNTYETNAILNEFEKIGFEVTAKHDANVCLINTCCITNQASAKSRKLISKAKKDNPKAIIIVMGCYSALYSDDCLKLDIDILVGNKEKDQIIDIYKDYINTKKQIIMVSKMAECHKFDNLKATHFQQTRAFLKIQDGCDNFCSYCIIPFSRGPLRSKEAKLIIEEINQLVSEGYNEVVLAGIHTGKYNDNGIKLSDLIEMILEYTSIKRIRISSIEITEIDQKILELFLDDRLAKHLHIPLQAGSDLILKAMNRVYNQKEFIDKIQLIKNKIKNIAITTDIIVGFPNESNDDFIQTLNVAKLCGFSYIHIFPFSKRDKTKAALMPDTLASIKKERSAELQHLNKILEEKYILDNVGTKQNIIIEQIGEKYSIGHSSNYLKIYIENDNFRQGDMIEVIIFEYKNEKIYGKLSKKVDKS